jgi:hypothetical protein
MKKKDWFGAIRKYVEMIIMPQFSELTGFEVEKSKRRKIPDFVGKTYPIDIKFYFDEITDDRRKELRREMLNMNRMLSIPIEFHTEHYLDGLNTW